MTTDFHEDWQNPDADPLAHTSDEFPYAQVFADLDGHTPPDAAKAAEALRRLLTWVVSVKGHPNKAMRHVCARALAMAWTTNPDLLAGKSLNEVAKSFGISADVMHRASADFSRTFSYRSPAQRHAWNWKPAGSPCPANVAPSQPPKHRPM